MLTDLVMNIAAASGYDESYEIIRYAYTELVKKVNNMVTAARGEMSGLIRFAEDCWGDGREMLLIVTELTADPLCVDFIYRFGCEEYFRHNDSLLTGEIKSRIDEKLAELQL
jgi:hypothetical protein